MEAMIFAAGLGTRLAPLTDSLPKALVPVGGRPLIGHVMDRLVAAGATRLIVNTSVHGDLIAEWLDVNAPTKVEIVLSSEPDGPYDTGGGLAAAAHLFHVTGPIILHNVDVLSKIPLAELHLGHQRARQRMGEKFVATLAVQSRPSSRRVLFDSNTLIGWGEQRVREPKGAVRDMAFSGIHIIEPSFLKLMGKTGTFPIKDVYLDLAGRGYVVGPADVSSSDWLDVGTPERLRDAETRWKA